VLASSCLPRRGSSSSRPCAPSRALSGVKSWGDCGCKGRVRAEKLRDSTPLLKHWTGDGPVFQGLPVFPWRATPPFQSSATARRGRPTRCRARVELHVYLGRMSFYVYPVGDRIVGVTGLGKRDDSARMDWVYVLPEQKAKQQGLRKMTLTMAAKAQWAVRFYQKLGCRCAGKVEKPWGFDMLMEKGLRDPPSGFGCRAAGDQ
jgi:hypothetical protein